MTGGGESAGEFGMVLDDPVVHQGHPARAVEMRMRVVLRRVAVGGPPGVADAGPAPAVELLGGTAQ